MMDRDGIVEWIRRSAEANDGRPPSVRTLQSEMGVSPYAWSGYWARWSDAIREAGYEPNKMITAIPEEDLLASLAGLVRKLGRFPALSDLRLPPVRSQGDEGGKGAGVLLLTRRMGRRCRNLPSDGTP